jgi:hypothetical protein
MHPSQVAIHWIQANRHALQTFAELVHAMPDPMSIHGFANIEDCHVTVEPFDPSYHGDIAGLIITDAFVTHVGRTEYRGVDSLVSLMFHTGIGLRAMYANLNKHFWQLVDSDVGDYIKLMQPQIDLVNARGLSKVVPLAGRRWVTREVQSLPDHLAHLPLNKSILVTRMLDHTVFGLELVEITSLGHCYEVATVTAVNKGSVEDLMQRLMCQIKPMRTYAVAGITNAAGALLNTLGEQADYANTYPLATLGLFANYQWQSSVLDQLPPHLAHAEPGQMVLSIGRLNGLAAYLELTHVVDAHGVCNIRTIRAEGVDGIGSMMAAVSEACLEYSRLEAIRKQHAERPSPATPSAPRPDPTIDVASLAIVKNIEECLQIDLGRAIYTLQLDLKAPLKRTMTITAPDTPTLNKAADSVYSTCVKIGKDGKRGCSVTVSRFARSVVVTITPTDRVIHI